MLLSNVHLIANLEAALAFAACGITAYTMAELPYDRDNVAEAGGGNLIMNVIGRTAFSADAAKDNCDDE